MPGTSRQLIAKPNACILWLNSVLSVCAAFLFAFIFSADVRGAIGSSAITSLSIEAAKPVVPTRYDIAAIEPVVPTLPGIVAEQITFSRNSSAITARASVQLAPDGMRISETGSSRRLEYVHNFTTQQIWLIDRSRAIKFELEINQHSMDRSTTSDDSNIRSNPDGQGVLVPQRGLLSGDPCIDMQPKYVGESKWRGSDVSVWHCIGADGQWLSTQYYSLFWRIVVREERSDHIIEELRSISPAKFDANHFFPKNKYRDANLRELLHREQTIDRYSE